MSCRKIFPPGWYPRLTNADYHSSAGYSSTQLKRMLEGPPSNLKYAIDNPEEMHSFALDLGTTVHALALEPQHFRRDFAVTPELNLRTKEGRAKREIFEKENAGKTIITPEIYDLAGEMVYALERNLYANDLLGDTIREQSIFWQREHELDGKKEQLLLKCRPDAISRSYPGLLDIKTCQDASLSGMAIQIAKRQYHLSAALYLEGVNSCEKILDYLNVERIEGFCLICIESKPPFNIACYDMSDAMLITGEEKLNIAINRVIEAEMEDWPGYPDGLRTINLPRYAERTLDI